MKQFEASFANSTQDKFCFIFYTFDEYTIEEMFLTIDTMDV